MKYIPLQRWVLVACSLLTIVPLGAVSSPAAEPQLVMLIVVDQLRGDMPLRMKDRFGDGGIRYLMEQGVVYTQANYRHSTTYTAVGHATLVTGGHAAQHGMVGNEWFDRESGKTMYCVGDDRFPLVGQSPSGGNGFSPANLLCTTFGDELVLATDKRSRVFSVSGKDRAAVLMGGHLGKAYWYASESGRIVTSSYYASEYPYWVKQWNAQRPADRYREQSWTLLADVSDYRAGDRDDQPYERGYLHIGRTFPHALAADDPAAYYSALRFTPMLDELTVAFARELLSRESLGQGPTTDALCVSLSATDYIGHAFGPDSLEAEDNLLRLDRSIAELLELIDSTIGLHRTLVILSSDHGICSVPEYLQTMGLAAGRHVPERFVPRLNAALREQFGAERDLLTIDRWTPPSFYLDEEAVAATGHDLKEVEHALVKEVLALPGFSHAIARSDLLEGHVPLDPILAMVQRAFHPRRSGNVLVVQDPSWFLGGNVTRYAAMHGSPYPYDTYVPLMLAGPEIGHRWVSRPVGVEDLAATVAAYLEINAPTGSIGVPLREVLNGDD